MRLTYTCIFRKFPVFFRDTYLQNLTFKLLINTYKSIAFNKMHIALKLPLKLDETNLSRLLL